MASLEGHCGGALPLHETAPPMQVVLLFSFFPCASCVVLFLSGSSENVRLSGFLCTFSLNMPVNTRTQRCFDLADSGLLWREKKLGTGRGKGDWPEQRWL